MNKHILPYSEKLNESIGRGSVLLIKGRPTKEGRFLYVTTINGYAEIKPGIKMVFIGDTIYRVIHKGGNKFSGRKVSYNGEDGLKGVFNMKNPGKPSVVLNHNKTPFHWLTLKHLDVGTALREIGPRLFDHELILESEGQSSESDSKSFLLREVIKLITGQPNVLKLVGVNVDAGGDELSEASDGEEYVSGYETDVALTLISEPEQVEPQHVDYLGKLGLFPTDLGIGVISDEDRQLLGLSNEADGLLFNIRYTTDAHVAHRYDGGDHWTSPSSDTEVTDVESMLAEEDPFFIEGDDVTIPADLQADIDIYNEMIYDSEPSDIVQELSNLIYGKVKKMGGFERDSKLNAQLRGLYYNYTKAIVLLKKDGLSDEDKKKWGRVDTIDTNKLKNDVDEIIKNQLSLEEIDKDQDQTLSPEQIELSNSYFDMIDKILPKNTVVLNYKLASTNSDNSIDRMNVNALRGAVSQVSRDLSRPDNKKLALEKELMAINYEKAKNSLLGKTISDRLRNKEEKLEFYLNQPS